MNTKKKRGKTEKERERELKEEFKKFKQIIFNFNFKLREKSSKR